MYYDLNIFLKEYNNEDVVIFGAGNYGEYLKCNLTEQGVRIIGFCDNSKMDGKTIFSLREILGFSCLPVFVIGVVNVQSKIEIIHQLEFNGVDLKRIIVPLQLYKDPFFDKSVLYSEHFGEELLNMQWNKARANNRIKKYFELNELWRLGVIGELNQKKRITNDLSDSLIQVIEDFDCISNVPDAIVILDVKKYYFIEEKLMREYTCPIIDIWRVIIA